MKFSTRSTPGAPQAARAAASRSAHERRLPRRITLPPSTSTVMRRASTSALRLTRVFDLGFQFGRGHARLDLDQVTHSHHAGQVADGELGGVLLELPVHLTLELDPALADRDLDLVGRHEKVPLQDADGRRGNVLVGALAAAGQLDPDLVHHGLHAVDALGRLLGRELLRVRRHVPAEGDHAVLYRDADVGGVHTRLPLQFSHDVALKLGVAYDSSAHV